MTAVTVLEAALRFQIFSCPTCVVFAHFPSRQLPGISDSLRFASTLERVKVRMAAIKISSGTTSNVEATLVSRQPGGTEFLISRNASNKPKKISGRASERKCRKNKLEQSALKNSGECFIQRRIAALSDETARSREPRNLEMP